MKPRKYYAVFRDGRVIHICLGAAEARKLTPYRAYKSFANLQDAEEFASWWNYEDSPVSTKGQISSRNRRSLLDDCP